MVFFAFTFHFGGGGGLLGGGMFFPLLLLVQPFLMGRRQRNGQQSSIMSWYSVMAVAVVVIPHLLQWCIVRGFMVGGNVSSLLSHPMVQPLIWTVFMGVFAACIIHSSFFHDVTLPNHTGRFNNYSNTNDEDVRVARMIRELPVMKIHACVDDLHSFSTSELKDIYRYYQCMNQNDGVVAHVTSTSTMWDRCLVEKSEVIGEIEKLMALRRHENTSMCSICHEEYTVGEIVRYLPECGHIYHIECIDQWCLTCPHVTSNSTGTVQMHPNASALTCPLCKRQIRKPGSDK